MAAVAEQREDYNKKIERLSQAIERLERRDAELARALTGLTRFLRESGALEEEGRTA